MKPRGVSIVWVILPLCAALLGNVTSLNVVLVSIL
jgi:hypothetical protein